MDGVDRGPGVDAVDWMDGKKFLRCPRPSTLYVLSFPSILSTGSTGVSTQAPI